MCKLGAVCQCCRRIRSTCLNTVQLPLKLRVCRNFVEGDLPFAWMLRLRHGSADARLRGLRVRIPPGAWMSVSYECCVSSGSATGRSLVQESPTECVCVCVCVFVCVCVCE